MFNPLLEDANAISLLTMQDNAASTLVDDFTTLNDGTLVDAGNTADISVEAGPNSYLPRLLRLDGTDDVIGQGAMLNGLAAATVIMWAKLRTISPSKDRGLFGNSSGGGSGDQPFGLRYDRIGFSSGNTECWKVSFEPQHAESPTNSCLPDTWYHLAVVRDGVGGVNKFYIDGVEQTLSGVNGSVSGTIASTDFFIGLKNGQYGDFDVALEQAWSRVLSGSEIAGHKDGPTPVNTALPTVTGILGSGNTLTCNNGTYDLPAPFAGRTNGSVSFTYQWYRADDNTGTGDVAISGATSQTYDQQPADINKYLRVEEVPTNLGGAGEAVSSAYTTQVGSGDDEVPPTCTKVAIVVAGNKFTFTFDEAVNWVNAPTVDADTAATLTYESGNGTPTIIAASSRTHDYKESLIVDIAEGDFADIAENDILAASLFVENGSLDGAPAGGGFKFLPGLGIGTL